MKAIVITFFLGVLWMSGFAMADDDLTGVWESPVGSLQIWQDGDDLRSRQNDPIIKKEKGEFMFIGTVNGDKVTGKIATIVDGMSKEQCGENYTSWVPLELAVSADKNLLEGKWERAIVSNQGCKIISSKWEPIKFTRNRSAQMTDAPITSGKKQLIGLFSLLCFALVFFFIRNAFVNYLVSSLKRSPNNAGLAGWGLFGGLLFGSAIGCAAIASSSYVTLAVISPLLALSLGCFGLCVIATAKK